MILQCLVSFNTRPWQADDKRCTHMKWLSLLISVRWRECVLFVNFETIVYYLLLFKISVETECPGVVQGHWVDSIHSAR